MTLGETNRFLSDKSTSAGRTKNQAAYFDGFLLHAVVELHANDSEGYLRLFVLLVP